MLAVYRHMFTIPDLRRKILFTLFIFFVYRLGATIVVPGINLDRLGELADLADQGGVVGLLNLFSGGGLENFSVLGLGIMPYITASIIMQLLAVVIPRLQALQEEGDNGRKVITQWTRYLTVILALIQSTTISYLAAQGSSLFGGISLIPDYGPGKALLIILTMTAGTSFVMWLGELITQRGVGNGMSLLIFISIISQLPGQFTGIYQFTASAGDWERFAIFIVAFLLMIIAILYVDQGQRRIPIQFAKRVRGRRVMGGQATYIPLKVNNAGVIPIIFATAVLYFPTLLVTVVPAGETGFWNSVRVWVDNFSGAGQNVGANGGPVSLEMQLFYMLVLFLLIVFFTYFYTAIQFDPVKQAETIQRQGGFVPGIRPGAPTARHLEYILSRITLPGSIFLGTVAILPTIVSIIFDVTFAFGGISILIVVGVALETMKQIESQLMMRNYEGFLA
ncbi:MAG: preprotein translocase subunit SecY [Acidimicrobiia bacterium]|nr:preprotein translocase subunit SecY [Acidimicrobiia bacterium]